MTEEVIASLTGREFMPAAVSVAGLEEIGTIRENTQTGTDAGDRPLASLKRVRERNPQYKPPAFAGEALKPRVRSNIQSVRLSGSSCKQYASDRAVLAGGRSGARQTTIEPATEPIRPSF